MDNLSANTLNQRRIIMFVAAEVFGIFTALVFYKTTPFAIREIIFPPMIGLLVFEFLLRTRTWLRPMTLPLYILAVTLVTQLLYGLLYAVSYGEIWSPAESLQFLFTEFPYNLYFLIESSVVTELDYFLIKVYRHEPRVFAGQQVFSETSNESRPVSEASNKPISPEGSGAPGDGLGKYGQRIIGFLGWFAVASLLAPFSYGFITFPVTLLLLLRFGRSKASRGFAGGILAAVGLNFVISLVRGMTINAICFVPFYMFGA